ncbi:hypothetical protein HYALB_00011737 [Hymenoscyphus albidus]|uniref:DUF7730 domain-containing protein n=1 Tax=Hymenoscyphus albidus TaxID=595503 RepID=A0A9N9LRL5_9HELO|nr:hypothetical protein HYALB_00011737 [Hymenoscyphus albidus]
MPPTQSDTVHSDEVQQRPGFDIDAPMTPRQQAIYERNATSSALIRLPIELRLKIWKLAIGENTIHVIQPEFTDERGSLICRSPVTASHAYQRFRCPAYEKSTEWRSEADMRCWGNRHQACSELNSRAEYLDMRILTLCRLTYIEIMETIWRTNTWSFTSPNLFCYWLRKRTTAQLSYTSRIHMEDYCLCDYVFSLLAERKKEPLERLQIYISPDVGVFSGIRQDYLDRIAGITECPPTREVEVIFYDSTIDHADVENESISQMKLWERSVAVAEEVRYERTPASLGHGYGHFASTVASEQNDRQSDLAKQVSSIFSTPLPIGLTKNNSYHKLIFAGSTEQYLARFLLCFSRALEVCLDWTLAPPRSIAQDASIIMSNKKACIRHGQYTTGE